MQHYDSTQEESGETISDCSETNEIAVADTGEGVLVFETGYGDGEQPSSSESDAGRLIGFANVTDVEVVFDVAEEYGYRGLASLPRFEVDDEVLRSFQAINKAIKKEDSTNE